jgi:hypothetical protein
MSKCWYFLVILIITTTTIFYQYKERNMSRFLYGTRRVAIQFSLLLTILLLSPLALLHTQTVYEANATGNAIEGTATKTSCSNCLNGYEVSGIGKGDTNYLRIKDITAATSGTYTITLYYLINGSSSFTIEVNDAAGPTLNLSGTSAATPVSTTFTAAFTAGSSNSIGFFNAAKAAPAVDHIVVSSGSSCAAAPGSLTLSASGTTSTGTTLSWTTPTEGANCTLSGYEVYQSGAAKAAVAAGTTSYQVTGLTASTAYSFYIAATNSDGVKDSNTVTTLTNTSLDPDLPPGGNFDLSLWELQLPVEGSSSGTIEIIPAPKLVGNSGFTDKYFYTNPTDGGMMFFDPEDGAHTANATHPRTELAEVDSSGKTANWPISGTNTQKATLAVLNALDHTCIGQVHVNAPIASGLPASTKPLLELYYYGTGGAYPSGEVVLMVEPGPEVSDEQPYDLGNIPMGDQFSYIIQVAPGTTSSSGFDINLTLTYNGVSKTTPVPIADSFIGYGLYFKAGDYLQTVGSSSTVGSLDEFYSLTVSHTD